MDPSVARDRARAHVQTRLGLPNYIHHLKALRYDESDLADGGSDRMVDDLVARGDAGTVAERLRAQFDAGADHVVVHPVPSGDDPLGLEQLRVLTATDAGRTDLFAEATRPPTAPDGSC